MRKFNSEEEVRAYYEEAIRRFILHESLVQFYSKCNFDGNESTACIHQLMNFPKLEFVTHIFTNLFGKMMVLKVDNPSIMFNERSNEICILSGDLKLAAISVGEDSTVTVTYDETIPEFHINVEKMPEYLHYDGNDKESGFIKFLSEYQSHPKMSVIIEGITDPRKDSLEDLGMEMFYHPSFDEKKIKTRSIAYESLRDLLFDVDRYAAMDLEEMMRMPFAEAGRRYAFYADSIYEIKDITPAGLVLVQIPLEPSDVEASIEVSFDLIQRHHHMYYTEKDLIIIKDKVYKGAEFIGYRNQLLGLGGEESIIDSPIVSVKNSIKTCNAMGTHAAENRNNVELAEKYKEAMENLKVAIQGVSDKMAALAEMFSLDEDYSILFANRGEFYGSDIQTNESVVKDIEKVISQIDSVINVAKMGKAGGFDMHNPMAFLSQLINGEHTHDHEHEHECHCGNGDCECEHSNVVPLFRSVEEDTPGEDPTADGETVPDEE